MRKQLIEMSNVELNCPLFNFFIIFLLFQLFIEKMPERTLWSETEDQVLKHLREDLKIVKWSHIARKMAEEYKIVGRNGKQCRERYCNHLDSAVKREEWTYEEQQYLYQLHNKIGNKWALIAHKMDGRTDNCVKNHFYSQLRKALRKLNKSIHDNFRKEFREIKMNILYKIIQATDDRFKEKQSISSDLSLHSFCNCNHNSELKNMLLDYSKDRQNRFQGDLNKIRDFIKSIYEFNKSYKRKSKKNRQNNTESKRFMPLPEMEKYKFSSDIDEIQSNFIDVSSQESLQIGVKQETPKKIASTHQIIIPTPIRGSAILQNSLPFSKEIQQPNSGSVDVEDILNNEGILKYTDLLSMSNFLRRSFSVYSDTEKQFGQEKGDEERDRSLTEDKYCEEN